MNRYRMRSAPRWWPPQLNPRMIRLLRGSRRRRQVNEQQLIDVQVRGQEHVKQALANRQAILITPNHPTHADAYSIYAAADLVGSPFFLMTAWQVFDMEGWLGQRILQWHGCFSVDREATDLQALRAAIDILQHESQPLVIFPEGEVYHCNARVRPFREGAAVIALSAAKHAKRPVVSIPCGLVYRYVDDPLPQLLDLMDELEREIFWRPKPDRELRERIYQFAETLLVIKEMEFLGQPGQGSLPDRLNVLARHVLSELEQRHHVELPNENLPERVKEQRRRIIEQMENENCGNDVQQVLRTELDDLFLVVQLFSYPGDYITEEPTIERMAETLDKFEEDVLQRKTASIRGRRKATIAFGEPVPVEPTRNRRQAAAELTQQLEQSVQTLIDQTIHAG